jgi:PAS domain S-box-containing protein
LLRDPQVRQAEIEAQHRQLRESQLLLEASRDRYADLYDFAPVGYVTFDDKGIIREINLTAAGMLGVERARLLGTRFHGHVAREDLTLFREHLGKLSSRNERIVTELGLARRGAGSLPVVMQSVLVYDDGNNRYLCRTAITDITERKRVEQAVRDNEARLRAVLDTAVDGIITIDERGIIESFNEAAERMFGYRADEVIGRNVSILMPLPHRRLHLRSLSRCRARGGGGITVGGREVAGIRRNGSTFPLELSVSRVQLAGRCIFTGIARDITGRKQAEESLREEHEFSKQVIDGAEAGIIVYDREGRVVVWNRFMEQLSGYRADEVLGRKTVDIFPFLREQDFEGLFRRALAGGIFESPDMPFEVPEKGRRGWKVERFAPLRDARRRIVGVIVAVRDITERRRLESELLKISDREQRRIGEDLHDGLGQQLTALEMKCFLLLEELEAENPASGREGMARQARQMGRALRDCITVTRSLSHGLAPLNLKADGLMEALNQLARLGSAPRRIECRFVCRVPVMLDDSETAGHLFRIAQEAVNNALKHARARRIHIQLDNEKGVLRLQVRDDGRGFPAGRKPRSGMGLEVMQHRAHVIGASLEIGSRTGNGVSVTCTLPVGNKERRAGTNRKK